MNEREKLYLAHLDKLAGEGRRLVASDDGEDPEISLVVFDGVPDDGELTAFSYGLSLYDHKEWVGGKPELIISVRSSDDAWALAMGECIRAGGAHNLFSLGLVIDFKVQISDESGMSAFLVFSNSVLNDGDEVVRLGNERITLIQLYPVHASEIPVIRKIGAEAFFFDRDIDFNNVKRNPVDS